jgi:hypothetical protein
MKRTFFNLHKTRGLSPRASAIVAQARPTPGPALSAEGRRAVASMVEAQANGRELSEADLVAFASAADPAWGRWLRKQIAEAEEIERERQLEEFWMRIE